MPQFKNLLLDEVIKEIQSAKSSENISNRETVHNRALQYAIKMIEAMK